MDNIVQTLKAIAETEDSRLSWEIVNNGVVIAVKCTSAATFANPEDAFADARRMVRELTSDGRYLVVNRASVGASSEPISGETGWRGTVNALLWPVDQVGDNHMLVEV